MSQKEALGSLASFPSLPRVGGRGMADTVLSVDPSLLPRAEAPNFLSVLTLFLGLGAPPRYLQ